jgi:hypothetical protein
MAAWVENEARRATRNLLIVNILILAAVIVLIAADAHYYLNFLLGCQRIEPSELITLTSATQRSRNFVTITGSKSAKTGYQDIEKSVQKSTGRVVSTTVKDEYVLLKVGDRVLLVKADPGAEKLEYSGELVNTDERVQQDLVRALSARNPEMGKMILPFTLNAADYREQGYWVLGVSGPLLLLAGWNIFKGFRRQSEPQTTRVWGQLAALGDPQQLSLQIDTEEHQPHAKYGKLHVTQSWLVRRNMFSTWVSPIEDLAWAYKKVTKHSVNFIPTGKTYAVVLVGRHRQRIEVQIPEKAVNALLGFLAARVPWAIYGFNQEINTAWQKDPAGFVAVVDSRRQSAAKAAAAAPAPAPPPPPR